MKKSMIWGLLISSLCLSGTLLADNNSTGSGNGSGTANGLGGSVSTGSGNGTGTAND